MESKYGSEFQKNTLYINNLNEKIKIDELKINLFHLFSEFGDITEINCRKSKKMKGQAFIVFKDLSSAITAKATLNNYLFLGKNIIINFAKEENDLILRLKEELSTKEKIEKDLKRKRLREKEYEIIYDDNKLKKVRHHSNQDKKDSYKKDIKISNNNQNNTLYVKIDGDYNTVKEIMIHTIFSKYQGFKTARLLTNKGICFVEYDNSVNAGSALFALNNFRITNNAILRISFVKN